MPTQIYLMESFWSPLPGHLLIEVFFALCLYLLQILRYYVLLRQRFHNVTFDIHYKQRNWGPVRIATTKVRWRWTLLEPVIEYTGKQIEKKENEGTFDGLFIMNPINLKIGEGVHNHHSYDGWNFPKIFIKNSDTFYVESSYLKPITEAKQSGRENDPWDYEEKFQAYVWIRQTQNQYLKNLSSPPYTKPHQPTSNHKYR